MATKTKSKQDIFSMTDEAFGDYIAGVLNRFGESKKPVTAETEWKVDNDVVDKCGACNTDATEKPTVLMAFIVYRQILGMMEAMGTDEWLGYLVGKYNNGTHYVSSMIIPVQEVSGTDVEVVAMPRAENIIGTVHSHHNMGSFFSSTDVSYVGSNHDVTIVTSKYNKWVSKAKVKLPCDKFYLAEGTVYIDDPGIAEIDQFVEEAKGVIQKKAYQSSRVVNTKKDTGNSTAKPKETPGYTGGGRPCDGCSDWTAWNDMTRHTASDCWLCPECLADESLKKALEVTHKAKKKK